MTKKNQKLFETVAKFQTPLSSIRGYKGKKMTIIPTTSKSNKSPSRLLVFRHRYPLLSSKGRSTSKNVKNRGKSSLKRGAYVMKGRKEGERWGKIGSVVGLKGKRGREKENERKRETRYLGIMRRARRGRGGDIGGIG